MRAEVPADGLQTAPPSLSNSPPSHLEALLALVVGQLGWLPALGLCGLLGGSLGLQGVGADGLVHLWGVKEGVKGCDVSGACVCVCVLQLGRVLQPLMRRGVCSSAWVYVSVMGSAPAPPSPPFPLCVSSLTLVYSSSRLSASRPSSMYLAKCL